MSEGTINIENLTKNAEAHPHLSFYGDNGKWKCERIAILPKPAFSGLEVLEVI